MQLDMPLQSMDAAPQTMSHIRTRKSALKPRSQTTNPTGLGLTVARQIIGLHGGRLKLANAPGGGAVTTVILHLH